jgi:hypothetical protein
LVKNIPIATGVTTTEPMYQENFILKDTQPTDNRLLHLFAYRYNYFLILNHLTMTRITAPKFRVGRYKLNEYELRSLLVDVANGTKPEYIGKKVTESGHVARFNTDGLLIGRLPGLHIATEFALKLMEIKNKNRNF